MPTASRIPDAGESFARLLAELEEGHIPDVDAFCAEHGTTRRDLREAWLHWQRGRQVLGGAAGSPRIDAYLERELADGTEPTVDHSPSDSAWSELLEGLAKHSPGPGRYRRRGEIARGGMGAILKVWDDDLKRSLAKKVLLAHPRAADKQGDQSLGRFLEEAQVTAQLEHPGIVPVHDLGVDPEDGVYFTMRLVRGRDLRQVFQQVRDGTDGWNLTRALGVLLKVCEAMAYAHSRGIVHRDLKPANVMVGRFGEVYVMDWGLARVLGKESDGERRGNTPPPADLTGVTTLRDTLCDPGSDSPLFTQDGSIVGTPAFMSPEQARGELDRVGPASDVYSVGAILYQLLGGRMPYASEDGLPLANRALQQLLEAPPTPIAQIATDSPAELIAICEKAMARDPEQRFADMLEFGEELRAYLEHRVVRSYRTGAVPEFLKWVQRNTATAGALAALVCVGLAATLAVAWQQHRLAAQTRRAHDFREAPALIEELNRIGPLDARSLPAIESWLASAEDLVSRLPEYRAEFEASLAAADGDASLPVEDEFAIAHEEYLRIEFEAELALATTGEQDGTPLEPDRIAGAFEVLPQVIERRTERIAKLQTLALPRATFEDPPAQKQHDRLRLLVRALTSLAAPGYGELAVMRRRLDAVRDLDQTLEHPRWKAALASIADPEQSPAYRGLELEPQLGLVPLRRDPASGLWEFLHVLSGDLPEFDEQGVPRMHGDAGIVMVLIPGGEFLMGAQKDLPSLPNYDPLAEPTEAFMRTVHLAPYFISKYELTLGQWHRATGHYQAYLAPGVRANASSRISYAHPVNQVPYAECAEVLNLWGLSFPTEAQHEFATRAGTTAPYVSSPSFVTARPGFNSWDPLPQQPRSAVDGEYFTARVDAYPANPFGLHNMLGNVREWCLEWYEDELDSATFEDGTGAIQTRKALLRTTRGGSYATVPAAQHCRVTSRVATPIAGDADIGLRPARPVFKGTGSRD